MKIELSEGTFRRLQQHSEPLVDTVESVIIRLLDSYESRKGAKMSNDTDSRRDTTSQLAERARPAIPEPHYLRGFQREVWELVVKPMPTTTFTLRDVYARESVLATRRPHVKELRASIRGTLEKLRDKGYVEFVDNQGTYRKLR